MRNVYNTKSVAEGYSEIVTSVGLWESERVICERYFKPVDRILDLACGAGRTTFGLVDLGYDLIDGVDLSDYLIKKARQIGKTKGLNVNFHQGDMLELKFQDNSFDGVFISNCGLMLIPGKRHRIKALNEVHRVLKSHGFLIFVTPEDRDTVAKDWWEEQKRLWDNGERDERLIDFGDRLFYENDTLTYGHFPSNQEVIECLNSTGFSLYESKQRLEICNEPVVYSMDLLRFWVARKRSI